MNWKEIFPRRLSWLMQRTRTTQTSIANQLKVSRQAVNQFLTGTNNPSLETLNAIVDLFGVSPNYLLGKDLSEKNLLYAPDGELYYHFVRGKEPALHGALDYSFGIAETNSGIRKFVLLSERNDGILLNPTIIHGQSHLEFLALVALLNVKLNFQYNPFERNDCDIILKYEAFGSTYQAISCDAVTPAHLKSISYSAFLETYHAKSTPEKVLYLAEFLDLPDLWRRDYD